MMRSKTNRLSGLQLSQDNTIWLNYRMAFIKHELGVMNAIYKDSDKAGQLEIKLLQNGMLNEIETDAFFLWKRSMGGIKDITAISDAKLCSFNNWFALHPEKVAGKEVSKGSFMFPVTIKGDHGDIDMVFAFLKDQESDDFEMEAEALEIELLLLKY